MTVTRKNLANLLRLIKPDISFGVKESYNFKKGSYNKNYLRGKIK